MTYHSIKSKMWGSRNGTYRSILRTYGDSTAIVATYLMTSPHARQSGLYSCPISYIASETERTTNEVEKCLQNLEEIHFCKYDFEEEVVWIFTMVEYQVSPHWTQMRRDVKSKRKQDSRYQGVLNSLDDVTHSYLHEEFRTFWMIPAEASGGSGDSKSSISYQTDHKETVHGASMGRTRGVEKEGFGRASQGLVKGLDGGAS